MLYLKLSKNPLLVKRGILQAQLLNIENVFYLKNRFLI